MPTAESRRAAYVAATRHREDLQIFVAREAVKGFPDAEMKIGRAGLIEAEARDLRSDDEIIANLAKALARADEPRNALDAMGISINTIMPQSGVQPETPDMKIENKQPEPKVRIHMPSGKIGKKIESIKPELLKNNNSQQPPQPEEEDIPSFSMR